MTTSVSMIGFGEAGAILGEDLAAQGVKIYAYDRLLEAPAKRAALRKKAQRCGVQLCESAAQAIALGEWIISAVTADNALEVALSAAPLMKPGQLFIDINSVAPSTKRAAATAL
jgi:3-hydroxyisobutyrate dehydrogenase-like beta-hydroxyacid dehydrogenase